MEKRCEIAVREGNGEDFELLKAAISEEQKIHAENRPDIFACSVREPFGLADFQKIIDDENGFFLVAEAGGQPAGICNVKVKTAPTHVTVVPRRFLYIDDICIFDGFRRQGVGRALYDVAAEKGRALGITKIELRVWAFNEEALAFYSALGMRPQNIIMEGEIPRD